jgi:hypothetical protein
MHTHFEAAWRVFLSKRTEVDFQEWREERAIDKGWLTLHESGTYLKFAPAGAEAVRLADSPIAMR